MSFITDYLKALWMGFISLPVILVIIQFLSTQLNLSRFGIFVTLYKGSPLSINYIVRWLLLAESEALTGVNFWAILITWGFGWLFISDWVKNVKATFLGVLSTYGLYIVYLSLYHKIALKLAFPESFIPILLALASITIVHFVGRIRRTKTFFDRLRESGVDIPEIYLRSAETPIICDECGAVILSNSKYCWKCGKIIAW